MGKRDKRVESAVKGMSSILDIIQKAKKDERETISREDFTKIMGDIQGHATTAFISLTVRPEHLDLTLESLQRGRL